MIANRMKPVLAAAAVLAALSSVAFAGENRWGDRGHGYHRVENNRWDRQGDGRRNRPAEIDRMGAAYANSVSYVRRMGDFYGGGLEAYSLRGIGRYIYSDNWSSGAARQVVLAPKAKIIDVEKEMGGNAFASQACAFEAGVCIIRGGN